MLGGPLIESLNNPCLSPEWTKSVFPCLLFPFQRVYKNGVVTERNGGPRMAIKLINYNILKGAEESQPGLACWGSKFSSDPNSPAGFYISSCTQDHADGEAWGLGKAGVG